MNIKKMFKFNMELEDELQKLLEKKYPEENIIFPFVFDEDKLHEQIKIKKKMIQQIKDGTFLYLNKLIL